MSEAGAVPAPVLECRGLRKTYASGPLDVPVLLGVDLAIARGERVAIVGASGSGKSTLLHLLGGLDAPTAGSVRVDGVDFTRLSEKERGAVRNRALGFIYQFHHLLPEFTALENVAFPDRIAGLAPRDAERRAEALLARVGLAERGHHSARALSGGEQQRVAIARALARNPNLLLADEPTGNLDAAAAQTVFALLRELHAERRMTTILVTHNPELAQRCDRLFTMSREGITPSIRLPERG